MTPAMSEMHSMVPVEHVTWCEGDGGPLLGEQQRHNPIVRYIMFCSCAMETSFILHNNL